MEWLQSNWLWILFVVGVFAMHMFGHGGHGGHGGHRRDRGQNAHGGHGDASGNARGAPEPSKSQPEGEAGPWQQG